MPRRAVCASGVEKKLVPAVISAYNENKQQVRMTGTPVPSCSPCGTGGVYMAHVGFIHNELDLKLLWASEGLPEYNVAVAAFLTR